MKKTSSERRERKRRKLSAGWRKEYKKYRSGFSGQLIKEENFGIYTYICRNTLLVG